MLNSSTTHKQTNKQTNTCRVYEHLHIIDFYWLFEKENKIEIYFFVWIGWKMVGKPHTPKTKAVLKMYSL